MTFKKELESLLNRYSMEQVSGDTPDYILANYLVSCLAAFAEATNLRSIWYQDKPTTKHLIS